jgi:hypothetical protein
MKRDQKSKLLRAKWATYHKKKNGSLKKKKNITVKVKE